MNHWLYLSIFLLFSDGLETVSSSKNAVTPDNIVIIIRNQDHKSSIEKADKIRRQIVGDAIAMKQSIPKILLLHEKWAPDNAWTIFPLMPILHEGFKSHKQIKWFYFCEDTTELSLDGLLKVLSNYDPDKEHFIGHALYDSAAAIIHHFAFYIDPSSFPFPDFDAGWVMSKPLMERAAKKVKEETSDDFSIDVKHEIAFFLSNQERMSKSVDKSVNGTLLTDDKHFCVNKALGEDGCVSTVNYKQPGCGIVENKKILIAVKTCMKFHRKRVPIIKETLGKYAQNIRYYSDVADESVPSEYCGVPNTDSGHCQKLHNIISKSHEGELKKADWLVVVDDDTIMSFKRLQKLLACYDPSEAIILGERYGYAVNFHDHGYAYPTGGGGMVLSRKAVDDILTSKICRCSSDNAPDDMWLGLCSRQMKHHKKNFWLLHTNSFHQAQSREYNQEFLSHRYLVSFHKHHEDPLMVYEKYLHDGDNDTRNGKENKPSTSKTEL